MLVDERLDPYRTGGIHPQGGGSASLPCSGETAPALGSNVRRMCSCCIESRGGHSDAPSAGPLCAPEPGWKS